MQSTTRALQTRCHLSKHERQRRARGEAFSRRSRTELLVPSPVKLAPEDVELIDRLVRSGSHRGLDRPAGDRRDRGR